MNWYPVEKESQLTGLTSGIWEMNPGQFPPYCAPFSARQTLESHVAAKVASSTVHLLDSRAYLTLANPATEITTKAKCLPICTSSVLLIAVGAMYRSFRRALFSSRWPQSA
jgi:hypothetical protein